MNLKLSNFSSLNYLRSFKKTNLCRFIFYICIAIIFYYFMKTYSPLGINWRPYHYERVLNSIKNIFENSSLSLLGYTSWADVKDVKNHIQQNTEKIYIVPIYTYAFSSLLYKIFGNFQFLNFAYIADYIFIVITGIFISEVGCKTIRLKNNVDSLFYGPVIFSLFLTSPWTYRMMIAPWYEVAFLGFYIFSIYLFIRNFKYAGLAFLSLSVLVSWIWGFFLFLFLILFLGISLMNKNFFNNNFNFKYLPNSLQDKKGFYLYSSACCIPLGLNVLPLLIYRFVGIETSNSTALFRIGLNNLENIHHGGLLGAFQFLGGNRYSLCFKFDNLYQVSNLDNIISIFNCSLSITSLVLLSLLSIFGLFLLLKNSSKIRWIFLPLIWSFLFYNFIFQQSFAAHLQGHSYVFGLIFSIGLTYLIKYSFELFKIPDVLSKVLMIPLITGIIVNSIRVDYITGLNG